MKKFICALLVMTASLMNADALLNAIKRHDLPKVTILLKQKKYDPISYVLYINSAREVVEQCRNNQFLQKLKPKIHPLFAAASTAAIIASLHTVYTVFDKGIDFQLNGKPIEGFKEDLLTYIGWNCLAGIMYGIGLIIRDGEIDTAYNQALKIQELILELPYG